MDLFVVSAVGRDDPLVITVPEESYVKELKKMVADLVGLPPQSIRLTYKGRELQETITLGESGIPDGAKIFYITTDMEGG